jgi:HEPN domain-containing protein
MQQHTQEWVDKAEGDFITAQRELDASPPNYDAVAFHAQQCAEKYLKARLVEAGVKFPYVHDLSVILDCAAAGASMGRAAPATGRVNVIRNRGPLPRDVRGP